MTAPSSRTGATDQEVEARDAAGREYFAGGLQGGYVESGDTFEQEMVGPSVAFRAGWARSAEWHAARAAAASTEDPRIAAVLALHERHDSPGGPSCLECEGAEWPCSTAAALLAEQPGGGK